MIRKKISNRPEVELKFDLNLKRIASYVT